jgi:ABC-type glycerol-3-phosphate transport system substrate-binding protein
MRKYIIWIFTLLLFLFSGCNVKPSRVTEINTLELAVFKTATPELIKAINTYNENNTNERIEIVNYYEVYSDPKEALNQIKIEIIAGKGPDMIDFGSTWGYSPLVASSGIMTDLYPLMENDISFDKRDFHYNILDSFAVGECLYVLVPNYFITSFTTNNSELSGMERIDIKQLVEAYNRQDDNNILFPGETKKSVLAMICYGGLGNYVDWDEGICYFDSNSFKEILRFANRFPLKLNLSNDYSAKAFFTDGRALLYPVSIDSVYGTAKTRILYGEIPTYIGYPFDSGNGNMADIANIAIGISGTSKYKEEAWRFIKSLLDSEFQDSIQSGLPVRISSLEQKLLDAVSIEHDANGEKIVKERLIWEGEEPVNIYEISAEDINTLYSILSKIEYSATVDSVLYNIILEETDYLFNDNRDINDVAKIIQNRAQLYINESK